MLQGKPPPTKAEVLERWRQSDRRYASKTDEEMADIYEMLMRRARPLTTTVAGKRA
jgi:hypothetical protein